jgi:hypothetical protein
MEAQTITTKRTFKIDGTKVKLPKFKYEDVIFVEKNGKRVMKLAKKEVELFTRNGNVYCADPMAVDYYGEVRGNGYPWIDEAMEVWAESVGCFWEWENCECIVLRAI